MAARTIPASPELTRRIRAAAAYGDFKSVEAFAAEVGMGRTTLYRVFRGERGLKEMEARQMLAVAGLPLDFFETDFSSLSPPALPPGEEETEEESDRPRLPPVEPIPRNTPSPRNLRAVSW